MSALEKFVSFDVTVLKEGNAVRHENLTTHKRSVAAFLRLEVEVIGAPSSDQFRSCWEDLRSGASGGTL